jgi:hypothetical protein
VIDFTGIDEAFGDTRRPEHFTKYQHCCECFESDEFFQGHTPATLPGTEQPPECLPIAFLTPHAFGYFMPALMRMAARGGEKYCLGDILFHVEIRLDRFTVDQRRAVRDLLYAIYDELQSQIHGAVFDYEAVWRILNRLDEEFQAGSAAADAPPAGAA